MTHVFDPEVSRRIRECPVIAVLIIENREDAIPLAKALLNGGITTMELTLRTPVALGALHDIRTKVPEMLAGVGTVIHPDQVAEAKSAGAAFGVSPGVNRRVIEAAHASAFPFAPGVCTPSDIETALEYGYRLMKFFPAEPSGGLPYLRSMIAPYMHLGLEFVPLGGLNAKNFTTYLAEPFIPAIGGSWLAPKDAVAKGDWKQITKLASEAVTAAAK